MSSDPTRVFQSDGCGLGQRRRANLMLGRSVFERLPLPYMQCHFGCFSCCWKEHGLEGKL